MAYRSYRYRDSRSNVLKLLNSPFVVTLIGGLIISLLGILLQHKYNEFQKQVEFSRKLILIKINILEKFSRSIERYLTLSHSNRKRAIYIKLWGRAKKENKDLNIIKYPDGKSYTETTIEYSKQRDYIYSNATPSTVCAISFSLFEDSLLKETIESLEKELETFCSTLDIKVLDKKLSRCVKLSNKAVRLMANEIKGDILYEIKNSRYSTNSIR